MAHDSMIAQFKSLEDLQAFAKAQQKTLIDITKKLKVSEDKVKHLEKLLQGTVSVIAPAGSKIDFSTNDEESIARQQLYLLKQLSNERELNLEETKRVEIYSKILINLKDKPKDINIPAKNSTIEQLMATVTSSENDDDRSDDQH